MSTGFYEDPVVFDILHASGTAAEVRGLERLARLFCRRHGRGSTWLEPACGTGRYLRAAARRGTNVIGFDLSPAMVRYAKEAYRRRPADGRARFLVADMTRFANRTGRVDFAFCPINTIRHLETDADMVRHLREVGRVLRPGAVYAVGLSTTAYGVEAPAEDVWEGRRGACHVKQIAAYLPPASPANRFEKVFSHLVITRGRREEHRDHAYRLRCFSGEQWTRVVRRSGLRIEAVTDDRGDPHSPGLFGYAVYILTR